MPSTFDSPAVRYGMSIANGAVIAGIAFAFLDGAVRWLALGIAALEVAITPRILKHAG